jgi:hypothetical protein
MAKLNVNPFGETRGLYLFTSHQKPRLEKIRSFKSQQSSKKLETAGGKQLAGSDVKACTTAAKGSSQLAHHINNGEMHV